MHAAIPVLRRVADDLAAQGVSVILTSADGVLERVCSDAKMVRALDEVGLSRGYSYAEEFAGTNGIGTSLETGRPTYIRGAEHYMGRWAAWPAPAPHSRRDHRRSRRCHRPDLLGQPVRSAAVRPGQECREPDRGSDERACLRERDGPVGGLPAGVSPILTSVVVMADRTSLPASDVDHRGIHHRRLGVGAAI
jgi:hypothetical protein